MHTVPTPEEGPTVIVKEVVVGIVKLRRKVVQALPAVKAALEPLTLTPKDVPVFFFIEKAKIPGVLMKKGIEGVTVKVRP